MIPRTFPGIVELDLITYQTTCYDGWIQEADRLLFENEAFFWSDYVIKDKDIILAAANADYLMVFHTVTKSYEIIVCENDKNGFSGIEKLGEDIILTSRKDGVIKLWESKTGSIRNFGKLPQNFGVDKIIGFSKLITMGSVILAIPLWSNMLLKIVAGEEKIECLKNYEDERNGNTEIAVCCAWKEEEKICCHNNILKCIDVFDDHGFVGSIKLKITENFCNDMENAMRNLYQPIVENSIFSFSHYPKYLLQMAKRQEDPEIAQSYGKIIYETIRNGDQHA